MTLTTRIYADFARCDVNCNADYADDTDFFCHLEYKKEAVTASHRLFNNIFPRSSA
jgi:hypothetical protein